MAEIGDQWSMLIGNRLSRRTKSVMSRYLAYDAFISYAREDAPMARRIRNELLSYDVKAFLDEYDLPPGERWKSGIQRAIRGSKYFIALLSSASVAKRGYVQKELREALDVASEMPDSQIFVIPVRLDECEPTNSALFDFNWVDIYKDFDGGMARILRVLRPDVAIILENQIANRASPIKPYAPSVRRSLAAFLESLASPIVDGLKRRLEILAQSSVLGQQAVFNLSLETSLPHDAWDDILRTLLEAEPAVDPIRASLTDACRRHLLRGRPALVPDGISLSGVFGLDTFINVLYSSNYGVIPSMGGVREFVRRLVDSSPTVMNEQERQMRLGRFMRWSYFNLSGESAIPSDWSAERISCLLGRGRPLASESLIVLEYAPPQNIPVCVPTVCDRYASAVWDYYFRVPALEAPYGLTLPWDECKAQSPLGEIVHQPIALENVKSVRLVN